VNPVDLVNGVFVRVYLQSKNQTSRRPLLWKRIFFTSNV